jgi:hypothetical protein
VRGSLVWWKGAGCRGVTFRAHWGSGDGAWNCVECVLDTAREGCGAPKYSDRGAARRRGAGGVSEGRRVSGMTFLAH